MNAFVSPHPDYARLRAVVLGATGFVGSSVALALARSGARVVCMVRDRARAEAVLRSRGIAAEVVEQDELDLYHAATDICLAPYIDDNLSSSAAITWALTSGKPIKILRILVAVSEDFSTAIPGGRLARTQITPSSM